MILGESFEQENARNDFTESFIENWYNDLEPGVKARWGVELAGVVRTATEAEDEYFMAMAMVSVCMMEARIDPTNSQTRIKWESAFNAMKAWSGCDNITPDQLAGTHYANIAELLERQNSLLAGCQDADETLEVLGYIDAARQEAVRINYLVKPPRAYAA